MVNLYSTFFFFFQYFSVIEPLSPSVTKISRRRRLHRLQSTHTRPLSRRNTAGRIIMYSISLRGCPLLPSPPSLSDLLSFPRTPPRSLAWWKRSRKKKRCTENVGTKGVREGSRAGRRRRGRRRVEGGLAHPSQARYTRIQLAAGPYTIPTSGILRVSRREDERGKRGGCNAVSSTRRSPGKASFAEGHEGGERTA